MLPDRHPRFELVHDPFVGSVRLSTMLAFGSHQYRRLAGTYKSGAVMNGHAIQLEFAKRLSRNLLHLMSGHLRMCLVFNPRDLMSIL